LDYRAAIVGPQGSGKTTLLEDLAPRLEELGFRCVLSRCNEDRRWQRRLEARELLLLDSAERLTALQWWRLKRRTRRAGGIIVTAHAPTRLATAIETSTSPQLLSELLRAMEQPREKQFVQSLFRAHDGNLREALRAMYDQQAA
jgi:hypothetical protein